VQHTETMQQDPDLLIGSDDLCVPSEQLLTPGIRHAPHKPLPTASHLTDS
jgi:hypothetical protein